MLFLLGNISRDNSTLLANRLPNNKEVLKRLYFFKQSLDEVDSRSNLCNELIELCECLEIEAQQICHINRKLQKLLDDYKSVLKFKSIKNCNQKPKVIQFINILSQKFDIESKVDPLVKKRQIKSKIIQQRIRKEELRKINERTIYYDDEEFFSLINDDESIHLKDDEIINAVAELLDNEDPDFKDYGRKAVQKILSEDLLNCMDRTGCSSRNSMRLIASLLSNLNYDLYLCTISYSTIWRHRRANRLKVEQEMRQFIDNLKDSNYTLHFDGVR